MDKKLSYLLLDNSTIVYLTEDINIGIEKILSLFKKNIVPFITKEVLLEALDVDRKNQLRRNYFFKNIPFYATLTYDNNIVGSLTDLRLLEYKYLLENDGINLIEKITGRIKIQKGELLNSESYLDDIQKMHKEELDKNFFISMSSSILYKKPEILGKKLGDLSKTVTNIPLTELFSETENCFNKKGDKKISDNEIKNYVKIFFDKYVIPFYPRKESYFESLDKISYLPKEYINQNIRYEDFLLNMKYFSELEWIAKYMNVDIKRLIDIDEKLVLSWNIEREYSKIYTRQIANEYKRKNERSSVYDQYLACFSNYFDVIVDKRTYEILSKTGLRNIFQNCHKIRNILDLGKYIDDAV